MTVTGLTGASGRLGRLVAASLSASANLADIVLGTRRPEIVREIVGPQPRVRFVDFDDPASLSAAFSGVDRLLVISTDSVGQRVSQHGAAFAAAAGAGVQRVIYTSMLKPTEAHPCVPLARDHRATESLLRDSGLAWTILRFGFFAEVLVAAAERAIALGLSLIHI